MKESFDNGIMSFAEIATELKMPVNVIMAIYEQAMRKILHPSNKEKWNTILTSMYGEAMARNIIKKGTWRVRKDYAKFEQCL